MWDHWGGRGGGGGKGACMRGREGGWMTSWKIWHPSPLPPSRPRTSIAWKLYLTPWNMISYVILLSFQIPFKEKGVGPIWKYTHDCTCTVGYMPTTSLQWYMYAAAWPNFLLSSKLLGQDIEVNATIIISTSKKRGIFKEFILLIVCSSHHEIFPNPL